VVPGVEFLHGAGGCVLLDGGLDTRCQHGFIRFEPVGSFSQECL
jgi:hypothetical protein